MCEDVCSASPVLSNARAGCTASGQVLTCGPFDLLAGATRQFRVLTTATAPGRTGNTARVVAGGNVTTIPPSEEVIVGVIRTCRNFTADGSRFSCSEGTEFVTRNATITSPNQDTCCEVG